MGNMKISKKKISLLLSAIAFLFYFGWQNLSSAPNGLNVYYLDIGQGDSILIRATGGEKMLIDGGPDDKVLSKLGEKLGPLDHKIDALVLTHPHADHLSGLVKVLERYEVGAVYSSGALHTSNDFIKWLQLIKEKKPRFEVVKAGDKIALGDLSFNVLYPLEDLTGQSIENLNNSSVVMKLEYQAVKMLFTGDAEKEDEEKMLAAGADLSSDILKAGHHGSATSTTKEFLEAIAPKLTVISSAAGNSYGHPSPRVLNRLEDIGSKIWRTDKDGDLQIRVADGAWRIIP